MKVYVDEIQLNALMERIEEVESKITSIENCYPIGSIYITMAEDNPCVLLGFGSWEQIEDRFLLAAGNGYKVGSTGGEATHTLTVNEIPSHSHTSKGWAAVTDGSGSYITLGGKGITDSYSTNNSGGGKAHNNMPPYLVVYMWKRIS